VRTRSICSEGGSCDERRLASERATKLIIIILVVVVVIWSCRFWSETLVASDVNLPKPAGNLKLELSLRGKLVSPHVRLSEEVQFAAAAAAAAPFAQTNFQVCPQLQWGSNYRPAGRQRWPVCRRLARSIAPLSAAIVFATQLRLQCQWRPRW